MRIISAERAPVKVGDKFGRLTAIGACFRVADLEPAVVCKCSCGKIAAVRTRDLVRSKGNTESCGCLHRERTRAAKTTHGLTRGYKPHLLYWVWNGMRSRCSDPKNKHFKDYGGRGITVCQEWCGDVQVFFSFAMSHGWQPGLEIDRENNDGNYEPGNCRFVTRTENCHNTRANLRITAFGETKCLAEWLKDSRCAVRSRTLRKRIIDLGWDGDRAMSEPPMPRNLRRSAKALQKATP